MLEQSKKKRKLEKKKKKKTRERESEKEKKLCYIHNVYFAKVLKSVSMCSDFPTNRSVKASMPRLWKKRVAVSTLKVVEYISIF